MRSLVLNRLVLRSGLLQHTPRRAFSRERQGSWLQSHLSSPQSGAQVATNEPLTARQRRIIHRCKQRGWLELDVILGSWAAKYVPRMKDDEEIEQVERLLEAETPHLYQWIIGNAKPHPYFDNEAFKSVQDFVAGK